MILLIPEVNIYLLSLHSKFRKEKKLFVINLLKVFISYFLKPPHLLFFATLESIYAFDEVDEAEEDEDEFDVSQIRERISGMSDLRQSVRQDLTAGAGTSEGRAVADQDLG